MGAARNVYRAPEGADVRRARWAIARAMVLRPSLVLVNDVTAGFKRADERELLAALAVAARQLGAGVVLATRDPVTASSTDRVLLLNRGRVVDDTAALTHLHLQVDRFRVPTWDLAPVHFEVEGRQLP